MLNVFRYEKKYQTVKSILKANNVSYGYWYVTYGLNQCEYIVGMIIFSTTNYKIVIVKEISFKYFESSGPLI